MSWLSTLLVLYFRIQVWKWNQLESKETAPHWLCARQMCLPISKHWEKQHCMEIKCHARCTTKLPLIYLVCLALPPPRILHFKTFAFAEICNWFLYWIFIMDNRVSLISWELFHSFRENNVNFTGAHLWAEQESLWPADVLPRLRSTLLFS